ncbi:glycosyltransferase family 4 protein [Photobacterium toruni]|uniref:glycosyltransferase family 4 protein n=1 Tax=Photobacterium toruni TaxID=1935446 RepID=UPI002110A118|nr:glycosyltransferase family 4 protein [Photobacterium toruni]
MSEYFASINYDVTILTFRPIDEDFFELSDKIKRVSLGFSPDDKNIKGVGYLKYNIFLLIKKLRTEIKNINPDIIISGWTSTNCFVNLSLIGLKYKIINCEHIHYNSPSLTWKICRRVLYYLCNKVIVLTDNDYKCFNSWLPGRVEKIINPITISNVIYKEKSIDKVKSILAVGRLDKQKGFDLLINAIDLIKNELRNNGCIINIVGDGVQKNTLKKQIEKNNLSDLIKLLPATKNISEIYNNSDLFILSSRYEGFGLVITEAMSFGLPIISYDCPTGPREILNGGDFGVLVPPENIGRLSLSILNMINDKEEREFYHKQSLYRYKDYAIEKIGKKWVDLFDEI